MLLAVDPGIHTGWCIMNIQRQPSEIHACGIGLDTLFPNLRGIEITRAIIEIPQIYPRSPVPPNDLIALAVTAGIIMGRLDFPWKRVSPHQWKGSVPKKIHNARVLKNLSTTNAYLLSKSLESLPDGRAHDVIDAVGLALYECRCIRRP